MKVAQATDELKGQLEVASVPLAARLVEVIADWGEAAAERYRYGSGCIVSGRTVLTAAHVVAEAVRVQVRDPTSGCIRSPWVPASSVDLRRTVAPVAETVAVSGSQRNASAWTCEGVLKPRVCRGRPFSSAAMASSVV